MTDDASLVAAARAGSGGPGFTPIYQRYGDRIHDYCLAVLRHREDAADAAQETFLIAYERIGQLRDPAKLTAWLYAIARSRCLRRIADRKRQYAVDDLDQLDHRSAAPTGEVEQADLRRLVWDAAAGLAPEDRSVLDLHLRQGLTGIELADALGVPTEKANLMLHRMKQRMARSIGALLVVRTGRGACAGLDAIAGGELTPLIRKRIARHIDRCQQCLARRDRLAPELLYASMPLMPAPVLLGDRVLELTSTGTPAGADAMRWGPDGFPLPGGAGAPMPMARRLAVGGAIAAVVVLGLLGGFVTGRTIGGDRPTTVDAAPTSTRTAEARQAVAGSSPSASASAAPAVPGPPQSSSAPVTSLPMSTSPTPSTPADLSAPTMSPLRVGLCGVMVTAEVDVIDTVDASPSADLTLSWNAGPGSPVPMLPVGGGIYRATMQREGAGLGNITFTAFGTVSDASGNSAFRTASVNCTPVVD